MSEAKETYSGKTSSHVTHPVVSTRYVRWSPRICLSSIVVSTNSRTPYKMTGRAPLVDDALVLSLVVVADGAIGRRPSPLIGVYISDDCGKREHDGTHRGEDEEGLHWV